ncbi:MAG: ketose-bisphosphate aldolase [Firmicutes bacterium]|nr:ketose-bisphosphate aldolase [Bacillota bacterium]MBQ9826119.1 ketose-bisphosphate aldolase [Bacillota bacterium]MBR3302306.1 ketose-bisphosphate aldolase [Bacillota bacterium]
MALVTTKEMFKKAYEGGYAVGAFNADSMDIIQAIIEGAESVKAPLILALSESAVKFIGPEYAVNTLKAAAKTTDIPIALHLDHGKSAEICKACVDYGFTSVMIDASAYDFDKNIEITNEVVKYAHDRGVVVESELGAVAGIEDDINVDDKYGAFTHPQDVVEFVDRTGIDSLAIAIGTAHGAYKFKPGQKPQLRFDILEEIQEKLPGFPLVLHGASSVPQDRLAIFNQYGGDLAQAIGIPGEMLRKAASMAVCKINVCTDIRVCWFGEIRRQFAENPKKFDGCTFLAPARKAVANMVAARITDVFGSNGKA